MSTASTHSARISARPALRALVDVVVAGGGPAGLAAAIYAASEGLSVTVLEQRTLPADKACGEGLLPGGVELLDEMGIRSVRSRRLDGIRYLDGDCVVEGRFVGRNGLGIRRFDLSRALLERARKLGVDVRDQTRVEGARHELEDQAFFVSTSEGDLRARWLVAADGLKSPLRRAFDLESSSRRPRRVLERFGWRRHYRLEPWTSYVEVHWSESAEAYVTPVCDDEIGIAVLWHGERPRGDRWLEAFPRLDARLGGAEIISTPRGAGPLRQTARRVTEGRLALVGDAAGYIDALTGEGIALGFRTAKAAVDAIVRGDLKRYERAYWALSRRYRATTELVLSMASSPRVRRISIRALALEPRLFERFLAWMS